MPHVISGLRPAWALPGARVTVAGVHLPVPADGPPHVLVGAEDAHVALASSHTLALIVPEGAEGGLAAIRIDELPGETIYLTIGRRLVTGIHQVDNPVYGADGLLYCTMSSTRGNRAPVPLFRIGSDEARQPIAVEIANPTSMAVAADGALFVSSRFEGQVYRLVEGDRAELYATELGVATGLAAAPDGSLFVGDRAGTVLKILPSRQVETYATLPSSVAAFHLALAPDGALYVSAPSLATHDPLYRITPGPDRLVEEIAAGFGRPQGLAFDSTGALFVVEALAGQAGIYKLDVSTPGATPELVLSAPALVGLAFDPAGGLIAASSDTLWRIDCDLKPLVH